MQLIAKNTSSRSYVLLILGIFALLLSGRANLAASHFIENHFGPLAVSADLLHSVTPFNPWALKLFNIVDLVTIFLLTGLILKADTRVVTMAKGIWILSVIYILRALMIPLTPLGIPLTEANWRTATSNTVAPHTVQGSLDTFLRLFQKYIWDSFASIHGEFPSGHLAVVMGLGLLLIQVTHRKWWSMAVTILLSLNLIFLSVAGRTHYTIDFIGSIFIACVAVKFVTYVFDKMDISINS